MLLGNSKKTTIMELFIIDNMDHNILRHPETCESGQTVCKQCGEMSTVTISPRSIGS